MKLIIQAGIVIATATDAYEIGPLDDAVIDAPADFDALKSLGRFQWSGEHGLTPLVPASVSPRQIRQALTRAGLRDQVEAAIAAGDQDLKDWWEFATAMERNNQHVIDMAAALGVSDSQLDDLWTQAETL